MFIILPSRYLYTIFLKNNKPHTPNIYTTILSKCIFSFHLPPTDTHLLFFTKKIFVSFLHFLYYIEWFFESALHNSYILIHKYLPTTPCCIWAR